MHGEPLIRSFDFHEHVVRPWTTDFEITFWVVAMGVSVAVACAVLGCFLVLRKKALIGDAISHALLVGLAGAFLLTGSRGAPAMITGAIVAGLATVALIEAIHRNSRIKEDAAIAVVFTALFALGVVLITRFTEGVDLDAQCVLYGEVEGSWLRQDDVKTMAAVALVLVLGVAAFFKELSFTSFDPMMAASVGVPARAVHYSLMAGVSVTVVCGMEAVGAILVVTMLIAPAATAYLLTDGLRRMIVISIGCGVVAAVLGYHVALWLDCSTAGAMSVVATVMFTAALLASPRHGVVMRVARRSRLAAKIARENLLRAIYLMHPAPQAAEAATSAELSQRLRLLPKDVDRTCLRLQRAGWLERVGNAGVKLTEKGTAGARRIVRAHRLWETFLVDQMGVASDHVHPDAEEVEHLLSEKLLERVDDILGHPIQDPHGSRIPRELELLRAGVVTTLARLREREIARVQGISRTTSGAEVARIAALGLPLGVDLVIGPRSGSSWTVRLPDGTAREIDHELADRIVVELRRPQVGGRTHGPWEIA